jgi:5-methylcytosine-specific restriction endonuclease McrBC regulatory subunit McrC
MKITVNQLRRIIKEEVSRVLKENPMEVDAQLEIPNVSSQAAGRKMSPEEWSGMVEMMAKKYPGVEVEGYSREYDSFLVYGPRAELTALAQALDGSFVGFIEEI